jgi:cephalosporin hydroxylase
MNAVAPIDELRQMIGFIANPPTEGPYCEPVREVMEGYTGPRDMAHLLECLDFFECAQDAAELANMLEVIRWKTSLLEVGSRLGGTLYKMAEVLAPESKVVSVDMPCVDGTSQFINPEANLRHNCEKIAQMGHRVQLLLGDSHLPSVVERVRQYGPYDFGFIDADHSYEGVSADFQNYGPMCKMVGFHDILNPNEPGCMKFWSEVKEHYRHVEIFNKSKMPLGIGIIYRD